VVDSSPATPRLQNIRSSRELSLALGVDYAKFYSFVVHRTTSDENYVSFEIPKKNGDARTIHTPKAPLKRLQRLLVPLLEELYLPPPCVTAHTKGRGAVSNAKIHLKKKFILNIDLTSYFDSIHFKRIVGILSSPRYSLDLKVATAIAQICCYNGRLPAGAPTSGIISNIVSGPLDAKLLRLAKKYNLDYSRYVDDITFSSNSKKHINNCLSNNSHHSAPILKGVDILNKRIVETVLSCGFSINTNKVFFSTKHARQQVTGITVNEKMNVPRSLIQSVRGSLHAVEKFGIDAAQDAYINFHRPSQNSGHSLADRVKGQIEYIGQVSGRGPRYLKLAERSNRILPGRKLILQMPDAEIATIRAEYEEHQATAFHVGNGFFLTADHAFPEYIDIELISSEQRTATATPVFRHERADFALFYTDVDWAVALPALEIGSHQPKLGDKLRVFGFPNYGIGNSISIINAEVIAYSTRMLHRRYDVSVRLEHGASGGPALSPQGKVVGLVHGGPAADDSSAVANSITALSPYSSEIAEQIANYMTE